MTYLLQINIYDVEVVLAKDKLTVNGREAGLPIVIEKMRVALIGGYIEVTGLDGASHSSSLLFGAKQCNRSTVGNTCVSDSVSDLILFALLHKKVLVAQDFLLHNHIIIMYEEDLVMK